MAAQKRFSTVIKRRDETSSGHVSKTIIGALSFCDAFLARLEPASLWRAALCNKLSLGSNQRR